MAQKRMLDKKISVSEDVANLTLEAKLLFSWMIPHADDIGLLPYSFRSLKALVVPMVDEITTETVGNHLEAMRKIGLIKEIQFEGDKFWWIIKFLENQTLKKDRQPQTLLKIRLLENPRDSWKLLESICIPFGIHLEPEVKEGSKKGIKEVDPKILEQYPSLRRYIKK